jgi:hypothetical protein
VLFSQETAIQSHAHRRRVYNGGEGEVVVQAHPDPNNHALFVQLPLAPMQFVILR